MILNMLMKFDIVRKFDKTTFASKNFQTFFLDTSFFDDANFFDDASFFDDMSF